MGLEHLALGRHGEDLASSFLEDRGWRIVARNAVIAGGELDIVALWNGELVVVEVRTRSGSAVQPAEDSVGPRKLDRLVRAGRQYVEAAGWEGPWRIDIVAVTVREKGDPFLEHFEDVTSGGWFP